MPEIAIQDEAPVVLGIRRSGSLSYPNGAYFVVPTTDPDAGGVPIQGGDLCVVVDVCQGSGVGVYPAHAVASGFTDMGTTTFPDQAGIGVRVSIYNKILTNADIGVQFLGVQPGAPNVARKMVCCYRMNRPLKTVSYVAGWGMGNSTGGSYACGPTNIYTGPTIIHGVALGDTALSNANYNWNGAAISGTPYEVPLNLYGGGVDATGPGAGATSSVTRCYYGFYAKGQTPVNVTQCNVSDMADFTYSALLVLQLT